MIFVSEMLKHFFKTSMAATLVCFTAPFIRETCPASTHRKEGNSTTGKHASHEHLIESISDVPVLAVELQLGPEEATTKQKCKRAIAKARALVFTRK